MRSSKNTKQHCFISRSRKSLWPAAKNSALRLVFAASVFFSNLACGQPNLAFLHSTPRDYVGQGQTYYSSNPADLSVNFYAGFRNEVVALAFGYWMDFYTLDSSPLGVGVYNYGPDVFGNGRGCNSTCGNFEILEMHTDDTGNIDRFWIRFTQYCECGFAPLTGEVRYNSQLAPPIPAARILHVPSDYPSIQSALDDAAFLTVDTVLVAPGTYHESVAFGGKRAKLLSESGPAQTFIVAPTGWPAVSFNNGETSDSALSGFTMADSVVGIYVSPGGRPSVVSNSIANCGTGIYCGGGGIAVRAYPLIQGNTIVGSSGVGVSLWWTSVPVIEHNQILENGTGIFMWVGGTATVRNNVIRGNHGDGIAMVNLETPNIIQNIIMDNAGNGIGFMTPGQARGPWIINNTILGNGGPGIRAAGGSLIVNNIVLGDPPLTMWGATVQFNDFYSQNGLESLGSARDLIGKGGNFSADPLFSVMPRGDLHVLPGSPCIDAGTNGAPLLPNTDFGGNPRFVPRRPNSSPTVDLGVFEFESPWFRARQR